MRTVCDYLVVVTYGETTPGLPAERAEVYRSTVYGLPATAAGRDAVLELARKDVRELFPANFHMAPHLFVARIIPTDERLVPDTEAEAVRLLDEDDAGTSPLWGMGEEELDAALSRLSA